MSGRPPPTSGLARGLVLGGAAVSAAAAQALGRLAPGAGAPAAHAGRALLLALLELRGAALKVAQFISLESDMLPGDLAREFSAACHRVPAMSPAFAREAVRRRVGPLERHFAHFEPTPFAAASIGQVHAATTLDGVPVAVKIQYPGMPETVRSDVRVLRGAARLLEHGVHYRRLLDEIESRLLEECDYRQEAASLAWFRERAGVVGVTIPRVHPAHSADGVLTTERLGGVHLEDWLRTCPSQSARDAAAQRLFDFFVHSMHVLRRLHADPNPGNVLFAADGSIGLIDFGCTRWIPADYHAIFCRLLRAAAEGDGAAAHAVYQDMGLFTHVPPEEARRLDADALTPFREWVGIPMRAQEYDFGTDAAFVAEGRRRFVQMLQQHALAGIRAEFVLVNRTLYGMYRVFERLGARVRCQAAWTSG